MNEIPQGSEQKLHDITFSKTLCFLMMKKTTFNSVIKFYPNVSALKGRQNILPVLSFWNFQMFFFLEHSKADTLREGKWGEESFNSWSLETLQKQSVAKILIIILTLNFINISSIVKTQVSIKLLKILFFLKTKTNIIRSKKIHC